MDIGVLIGAGLTFARILRFRRSSYSVTALVAYVCLLIGTAIEVVLISVDLYGGADPAMIADLVRRVVGDTAWQALPFVAGSLGVQALLRRIL